MAAPFRVGVLNDPPATPEGKGVDPWLRRAADELFGRRAARSRGRVHSPWRRRAPLRHGGGRRERLRRAGGRGRPDHRRAGDRRQRPGGDAARGPLRAAELRQWRDGRWVQV